MGFFDEIIKLFNDDEFDSSYKIIILGSCGAVIEGYKKIVAMAESEIVVGIKNKKKVVVSGARLFIKKLEKNEVVIAGNILNVQIV